MIKDDLANGYVLGTLDEEDETRAGELLTGDASFAAAVARSEEDLRDIKRGLDLVAADALHHAMPAGRSRWVVGLAAAAVLIAVVGGAILASRGNEKAPVARGSRPPTSIGVPGPTLTLEQTVKSSSVIVVGTVTDVQTGSVGSPEEGGMEYAMATIRVEERIKGSPGESVVAFDYVYGIVSSEGGAGGVWAKAGDRLLVFLVSDAGAISEDLKPDHLQIAEGARGRFRVSNGELVDAPYTLQDVRDAAAKS